MTRIRIETVITSELVKSMIVSREQVNENHRNSRIPPILSENEGERETSRETVENASPQSCGTSDSEPSCALNSIEMRPGPPQDGNTERNLAVESESGSSIQGAKNLGNSAGMAEKLDRRSVSLDQIIWWIDVGIVGRRIERNG